METPKRSFSLTTSRTITRTITSTIAYTIIATLAITTKVHADKSADKAERPTKPSLTVTATQVGAQQMSSKLIANGSVAAWQEASIGSELNGLRIEELHANVGDVVKAGQVLASFATDAVKADVAQARAAFAETEATAMEATLNADRARGLQSSGAISKQQIGQYLTAEQTAKARVAASKASLDVQLLRLKHTQVVAPDAGVISARMATVGSVVGNGAELFRMIRQGRLEWRAEVTSADLSKLAVGMEAIVIAPNGDQAKGKVRMLAPTVDTQNRIGLVYVDLVLPKDKKPGASSFKSGMFARGEFAFGSSQALSIPQQSLVVRDGFNYVFKLNPDQRVTQVKVQTGRRMLVNGVEQIEILSGINAGAQVVSSGAGFLNDGDVVKLVNTANLMPVAPSAGALSAPPAPAKK